MLDLTNLDWPVSLLRFNDTLRSWPPDSILEVWIRDPRLIESVKMIVQNSNHQITGTDQAGDRYSIWIRQTGDRPPASGGGSSGDV